MCKFCECAVLWNLPPQLRGECFISVIKIVSIQWIFPYPGLHGAFFIHTITFISPNHTHTHTHPKLQPQFQPKHDNLHNRRQNKRNKGQRPIPSDAGKLAPTNARDTRFRIHHQSEIVERKGQPSTANFRGVAGAGKCTSRGFVEFFGEGGEGGAAVAFSTWKERGVRVGVGWEGYWGCTYRARDQHIALVVR